MIPVRFRPSAEWRFVFVAAFEDSLDFFSFERPTEPDAALKTFSLNLPVRVFSFSFSLPGSFATSFFLSLPPVPVPGAESFSSLSRALRAAANLSSSHLILCPL
jgi:hypothetical protein